mgnify:CR=1 FL=1
MFYFWAGFNVPFERPVGAGVSLKLSDSNSNES